MSWRRLWRIVAGWTAGLLIALTALVALGLIGFKSWQWVSVDSDAPLIAISADTAWHARLRLSTSTYEAALTRVNARILTVRPGDDEPQDILDRVDGLLLAGGGDVDPRLYGGDPATGDLVNRQRDEFETALISGALSRDMPILGICRGIQVLNVASGGSLRDLRDEESMDAHAGAGSDGFTHDVTIEESSRLAGIDGPGHKEVNSFHGQVIDRVGSGLVPVAWSADGMIEALEGPGRRFVLAVQWHPEILQLKDEQELAVFEAFLRNAREYAGERQ